MPAAEDVRVIQSMTADHFFVDDSSRSLLCETLENALLSLLGRLFHAQHPLVRWDHVPSHDEVRYVGVTHVRLALLQPRPCHHFCYARFFLAFSKQLLALCLRWISLRRQVGDVDLLSLASATGCCGSRCCVGGGWRRFIHCVSHTTFIL